MTYAIVLGLIFIAVGLAWFLGKQGVKKDLAEKNQKIKDKQVEIALNPPDKRTVIGRLRNGKF